MKRLSILALSVFLYCTSLEAQNVLRGPYFQVPTSTSMKVMWRTDIATPSRVYYATTLGGIMSNSVDVPASVTDHTVELVNLQPYTEYYYAISDGTSTLLAGGDEDHKFRTSPEIGTVQPISVWAIGDFGKGNSKQVAVKDAYLDHIGDDMPDMWLWLGDNAYPDGTDQEYTDHVFGEVYGYGEILPRVPFMATPGNHDYLSVTGEILIPGADPTTHDGPYYDVVDVPINGDIVCVTSVYDLYYSFDYGNVHFMSLNSEIGNPINELWDWTGVYQFGSFDGSPFIDWMHADLQANDKPWVVAFIHQPPHTDGSHESGTFYEVYMEAVRENICPILESYGVDLLIAGHSHVYERSFLVNGFYGLPNDFNASQHLVDGSSGKLSEGEPYIKYTNGPNQNLGIVYVVQGNSGSTEDEAGLEHPVMYYGHACDTCVGSTMLYIHGDTLSGEYLTKDGEILDEWTIIKQADPTSVEDASGFPVSSIDVYPNPFNIETTVQFEINEELWANVELVDLKGRILHELHRGGMSAGTKKFILNVSDLGLAKGAYLIRVITDKRPAVARIIKVE